MVLHSLRAQQSKTRVHRAEALTFLAVAAGLMIVTAVPYAYGYISSPPAKQFMGILLNVPDTAQYLSWARESSNAVFIENKLTAESGQAVYVNLFWLVVGRLARILGIGLAETLQLLRPLAGIAYLVAIYWFIILVEPNRLYRWVTFFVIALGGGIGWLLVVLKQFTGELLYPLDLYVTEANTFLTILAFPHQAMAGALLVSILCLATIALERRCFRLAMVAGLLGLLLGLQHGYDLLIVYSVVGMVTVALTLRTRDWLGPPGICATIGLMSAPAAAYVAYITSVSPIWRGVLSQYGNAGVYTPEPLHLLILMGLPLLLILGTRAEPTSAGYASLRELVLGTWLVVGFLLLYVPTDFQIKMLAGWQIPVGVVATRIAFTRITPAFRELLAGTCRLKHIFHLRLAAMVPGVVLILLVMPVNSYLLTWRLVDLNRHDYPYYLHHDELAAMRWLEAHSTPSDVVLSSLTIGQYIPSVSGNNAFLAHWAQTLDFYEKREMVTKFFDPTVSDQERAAITDRFNVRYVFYGREEREMGSYTLASSSDFERVFVDGDTSIFRVKHTDRTTEVRR